jgi:tRNA (guanine37-N1)-methyltransferase
VKAHFQVITLFPAMIESLFADGVIGNARKKNLIELTIINPREFTIDVHHTVDDRPFGGGDGMIGLAEPLWQSWQRAQTHDDKTQLLYLSPQGETLTDSLVRELAQSPRLTLLCGRYGGVDQRFLIRSKAREISIGDYVLSGGELAAGVVIDAVSRQVPGVLGHADSAQKESFASGGLEAPQFTRPRQWQGLQVPEALMSGHHVKIEEWRRWVSLLVTIVKRPDLVDLSQLSPKERKQLKVFLQSLPQADVIVLGLESLASRDLDG